MLSAEALEEFKKLYEDEYKIQLNDTDALEYGTRLISFVKAVYGNKLPTLKNIDNEANKTDN